MILTKLLKYYKQANNMKNPEIVIIHQSSSNIIFDP
jgi:hypothetical protein